METIGKGHFTLKRIFEENWERFVSSHRSDITFSAAYNVWKVMNCREPNGLGYTTFACPDHPDQITHIPRSCKSRFCPVCAKIQVDKWVADMNRLFPNCPYFHITFTVPSQFRILLFEKRSLLNAVFSAGARTLLSFLGEQGILPAITAVLHTFGSDLKRHVHVHFIVSAGGLKLSGKAERFTRYIKRKAKNGRIKKKKVTVLVNKPNWVHWSFFPHKVLRKRYQNLLIEHLKERIQKELRSDAPDPDLMVFSEPSAMKGFFDDLKKEYKNGFYVHISKERKDLQMTVGYIGRYARRPPLSEVRIKNYTGEWITFEYKDYRNGGGKVLHTLKTIDFIGRLIRHIPPHYFNVIRHFGILASRVKKKYKEIADCLLEPPPEVDEAPTWRERQTAFRGSDPLLCGICGRVMRFVSSRIPIPLWRVKERLQAAFS